MTAFELATMSLSATIKLRVAEKSDIPKLEWNGQYSHFRSMFRRAYREQVQGRRLILILEYNKYPIGHIFIQFTSANTRIADGFNRVYFYSFRVMEPFRGQGVGTWLMHEAEAMIFDRGFRWATIAVAKDNRGAIRLYERLGYRKFAEDPGQWNYLDHRGAIRYVDEPCWILEKRLDLR
jgi:ribosomal protein S18 acetylase RimI-like enzyme